jgi:voltage-gated potassium channel
MPPLPVPAAISALRRRQVCYVRLLLLCLLVMGAFALPYGWSRVSAIGYNLLPLVMLRGLSAPIGARRFEGWWRRLYLLMGLAALASGLGWYLTPVAMRSTGVVMLVIWTLFVGWSTLRLVAGLGSERRVNTRVLMGAVAGYLLIGLTAGLMFSALETIQSGSFNHVHGPAGGMVLTDVLVGHNGSPPVWHINFVRLNYFAFVSLTTLGFGDIYPVTPQAQMATVAVAVVGTIYLAVVMGLLIGRYTVAVEESEEERHQHSRES